MSQCWMILLQNENELKNFHYTIIFPTESPLQNHIFPTLHGSSSLHVEAA